MLYDFKRGYATLITTKSGKQQQVEHCYVTL
jgi:hypothetical protein